jgi:hypothetical protein
MSQAHAQKYYDIVAKDPALLDSLGAGTKSADEFIARAIAAAKQQGLEFSAEEAKTYLEAQEADSADGELSDQQLEAVAGGKGGKKSCIKIGGPKVYGKVAGAIGYSWGWS